MDEKKVREAAEYFIKSKIFIESQQRRNYNGNLTHDKKIDEVIGFYKAAIEALEKQLPRKGIKGKITEGVNKGLHEFYCPVCYRNGDLSNKCNVGEYCSDCGQRLDWRE